MSQEIACRAMVGVLRPLTHQRGESDEKKIDLMRRVRSTRHLGVQVLSWTRRQLRAENCYAVGYKAFTCDIGLEAALRGDHEGSELS